MPISRKNILPKRESGGEVKESCREGKMSGKGSGVGRGVAEQSWRLERERKRGKSREGEGRELQKRAWLRKREWRGLQGMQGLISPTRTNQDIQGKGRNTFQKAENEK